MTTAAQLGLPFDFPVMRTWTDTAGDSAFCLEFSVGLTPTGARLQLVGPWPTEEGPLLAGGLPPVRGVLWRAVVDMADSRRTCIAPPPVGCRAFGFPTRLPLDCFSAPLAWAAEVGRRQGVPVEALLMTMRRSLVTVGRHLERLAPLPAPPREKRVCAAAV